MYLSVRLTQTIQKEIDSRIVAQLERMQEHSACAGIPSTPGPRSRKSNASAAQKARINHHGDMKTPARRFVFAPVGGWGEDVVPPEYYRELRKIIAESFSGGSKERSTTQIRSVYTGQGTFAEQKSRLHVGGTAFGVRDEETGYIVKKLTGHQILQKIADKMAESQIDYIKWRYMTPNAAVTVSNKKRKEVTPPDLPLFESGELIGAIKGWVE